MTDPASAPEPTGPEPTGTVADAVPDNWVDRSAPKATRPYLRLSRADRPIGTWLLLLPCWWGVLLAAAASNWSLRDAWILAACAMGAWLMRGAGCTWNDFTDREIDAQVARTRSRPLPSGQVTPRQALLWMGVQALLACALLVSLGPMAILLGVVSLGLVAIYPFAKRFTWWPQVFLGLAFNWGALLAWAAHSGELQAPAVLLYLAGIAWTLFYDTIYAHQDTEDDALIGVKSTARLFGDASPSWLRRFLVAAVGLMTLAVITALAPLKDPLTLAIGLGGVWGFGWHLAWQMTRLDIHDPNICMSLFRANRDAGLIPTAAFALALMI